VSSIIVIALYHNSVAENSEKYPTAMYTVVLFNMRWQLMEDRCMEIQTSPSFQRPEVVRSLQSLDQNYQGQRKDSPQ